ncbi:MAG: MBL fold hydrolase [Chloroflexi bacterium RBG_13_51_36]|nr:MAG: MBL fold hydrolase [Chloroflexi bacterium RBG_13_51_36]
MAELTDTITFLGTAAARFVLIHQFLASGGAWLNLGDTQILLDPGPGSLVQVARRKLDPSKLDAIILSHKHLDHSGDINIMIEAMTDAGTKKRGMVFAPADALNQDPVILSYLRSYPQSIQVLTEDGSYTIDDVSFRTPVRHKHPVETYGFIFRTPRHTFSWITDTRYFEGLAGYYEGDLLIINVVRLNPGAPLDHLSLPEAGTIIEKLRPKTAILTHFGMTMWRARTWELAKKLTEETGVTVIAARDGLKFDLAQLDK